MAAIVSVSAIVAGITIHAAFAALGILPSGRRDVEQLATFAIDCTFFLNLFAAAVAIVLVVLGRRGQAGEKGAHRAACGAVTMPAQK